MPPYKKPVSESQRRYMFILEREGKLPKGEARAKSHAVKGKKLPKRIRRKRGRSKGRR